MENIILIKTQSIEFIQGERKRDAVNIAHHAHVKIDDNAIINGVIIDDTSIKEALAELKSQYDIEECILILDIPNTIFVITGISYPWKTSKNCGMITVNTTIITITVTVNRIIGYVIADLIFPFNLLSLVNWSANFKNA